MKRLFLYAIVSALFSLPIFLHVQSIERQQEELASNVQSFGADQFNFVAGLRYKLAGSGVGTTDTTIKLQSFKQPISNLSLTMSDFGGSIGYLTLEPGSETKKEFVSFTSVTQNSDGTADLGGITRGLGFVSPYSASTTLRKAHSGGSIAIVSNPPQLYDKAAFKDNDETINNIWQFVTPPIGVNSATASNQFITKSYADNLQNTGAATSTESTGGLVELATLTEVASSTASTLNKPLVVQAQHATSTPGIDVMKATSTGAIGKTYIVVSEDDGKINQNWIDLIEPFTFSTSTSYFFNVGTLTATNTARLPASLRIGNVAYTATSTQGTFDQVLTTDSAGTLKWSDKATTTVSIMPYPAAYATGTTAYDFDTNTRFDVTAYVIPYFITVNKISFYVERSITTPGQLNIGIYDEQGIRVLSHTTNSMSGGAGGSATTTTLSTPLRLSPGVYYIGFQTVGSANMRLQTMSCTTTVQPLNVLSGSEPRLCGRITATASTLPTTINTVSDIDGTQGASPMVRLDN